MPLRIADYRPLITIGIVDRKRQEPTLPPLIIVAFEGHCFAIRDDTCELTISANSYCRNLDAEHHHQAACLHRSFLRYRSGPFHREWLTNHLPCSFLSDPPFAPEA